MLGIYPVEHGAGVVSPLERPPTYTYKPLVPPGLRVNSVVLCGYLYTPQHIVDSEENLLAIDEGTPYHCASNITYEKFLS